MNNTNLTAKFIFFLTLVLLLQPAFCDETAVSSTQRIFDEAELLSETERSAIQLELEKVSNDLGKNFIVVTKKQLDGTLPRIFAEEFFHSQGYESGAILVTTMAERDYYFATLGTAIKEYEARSSSIQRHVQKLLSRDDYHGAFMRFAQLMRPPSFFDKFMLAAFTWPPLVIALILTLLIVGFLAFNHRGALTVTSNTYASADAFKLISTEDRYLRTTTTKTKIESDKSDDSGSSESSGGGGGSF